VTRPQGNLSAGGEMGKARARVGRAAKAAALTLVSVLLGVLVCEIGLRAWQGEPVFALKDFRTAKAEAIRQTMSSDYDAALGWRLLPNIASTGFNTLDQGIRKNNLAETTIRTGGILAVGDSFAAGSEVVDEQSWPAQLEAMVGRPVLNGGVGGYGSDQIIMRAEQLLPVVKPKVLLVGMLESDIDRSGFSSYGKPKPYFTIEAYGLALHNTPVPLMPVFDEGEALWRRVIGHSAIGDLLMSTIDAQSWYAGPGDVYRRVGTDEPEIVCRLLQRLKRQTDAQAIRTILVMQHGSSIILNLDEPRGAALRVEACARAMGIQVVDEFDTLKAIAKADPAAFAQHYVSTAGTLGHMSARGNALVAGLIAKALSEPPATGRAEGFVEARYEPGDGTNLLRASESAQWTVSGTAFASLTRVRDVRADGSVYRLEATGQASEHYIVLAPVVADAGGFTLSLETRAAGTTCLRLQLIDDRQGGLLADFNLAEGTIGFTTLGKETGIRGGITPLSEGWHRLWMSAMLRAGNPHVALQLSDATCNTIFAPAGQAVEVRAIQLERGQSASAYQPTSGPRSPGFVAGDGNNLLAGAETLDTVVPSGPIATLTPEPGRGAAPRSFRLAAIGPPGEHYVAIERMAAEPGPYTLSMEVRAAGGHRLRLHLADDGNSGALGDFDLEGLTATFVSMGGAAKIDGDITAAPDGWRRISLTATLSGGNPHVLLQLMDGIGGSFAPKNESVVLRAVKLERGESASPYQAASGGDAGPDVSASVIH
jgi:hypothetical protein